MMNLYKRGMLMAILMMVSAIAIADVQYQRLVVLGDSLSDVGNLASIFGDFPSPPYFNNHITNGPVAVEILADKMELSANASFHLTGPAAGTNYAVAGAKISGTEAIDLSFQLNAFLANNGLIAEPDTLFVIFAGANDIRGAVDSVDQKAAKSIIGSAANQVRSIIQTLIDAGARSFLVINAPDLGNVPEAGLLAAALGDPGLKRQLTKLSKLYRHKLKKAVRRIKKNNDVEVVLFDLFRVFNRFLKRADKNGFTNTDEACFNSTILAFNDSCNFGSNINEFVFFDEVHPTARVHEIFGNKFYKAVMDDDKREKSKRNTDN